MKTSNAQSVSSACFVTPPLTKGKLALLEWLFEQYAEYWLVDSIRANVDTVEENAFFSSDELMKIYGIAQVRKGKSI